MILFLLRRNAVKDQERYQAWPLEGFRRMPIGADTPPGGRTLLALGHFSPRAICGFEVGHGHEAIRQQSAQPDQVDSTETSVGTRHLDKWPQERLGETICAVEFWVNDHLMRAARSDTTM
jgi:hypothetical protein